MRIRGSFWRGLPGPWALALTAGVLFCAGLVAGYAVGRRGPGRGADFHVEVGPVAGGSGTWTLATYNVKNFFDGYDNPYTADEGTRPKPAAELDALVSALQALNADVVIMQEVESGGFLKRFNEMRLPEAGYKYVVDESTEDPRGISVAALSRFPVVRIVSHRLAALEEGKPAEAENRFARDLLRVDVEPRPGYVVAIYGVHLKSKLPDNNGTDSGAHRLAEARRARQIIQEEMATEGQARFVLLGDFNDTVESAPVQALTKGDDPAMFDTLAYLPSERRITFEDARYKEGIDGIWVAPALREAVEAPGAEIVRGGAFERASDHRPVRVRLGER